MSALARVGVAVSMGPVAHQGGEHRIGFDRLPDLGRSELPRVLLQEGQLRQVQQRSCGAFGEPPARLRDPITRDLAHTPSTKERDPRSRQQDAREQHS